MAKANVGDGVVDPGMVTDARLRRRTARLGPDRHVGELVGELAAERRREVTDVGAALACAEIVTESPSTIVTVSGAPLPEYSAIVG